MARGLRAPTRPFLREKFGHTNLHRGGQPRPGQPKSASTAGRSLFARAVQARTDCQARPPHRSAKKTPANPIPRNPDRGAQQASSERIARPRFVKMTDVLPE